MHYHVVLIRYGELSLKSTYVRNRFESILIHNIKKSCSLEKIPVDIRKERGRIYLYTKMIPKVLTVLPKIFGVVSFSPAMEIITDIDTLATCSIDVAQEQLKKNKTFALRVQRSGIHPFTSQEVAEQVGRSIVDATSANVDLSSPDIEIFIEIRDDKSFIFTEKIPGPGGLPYNTQGKILAIIDSTKSLLAAWYLLHRGCTVDFILTKEQYKTMTESFIHQWYLDSTITLVEKNKHYYRELNQLLSHETYQALVTDSTLSNQPKQTLKEIQENKKHLDIPVLTPLISMDKKEIDTKTKELGFKL